MFENRGRGMHHHVRRGLSGVTTDIGQIECKPPLDRDSQFTLVAKPKHETSSPDFDTGCGGQLLYYSLRNQRAKFRRKLGSKTVSTWCAAQGRQSLDSAMARGCTQ